ncbi:MAG: hypothetical protein CM15mP44_4190 [Candidatus Neomarinimicrobiota bacterium]|nr:MAG: hypothetical protein CM15mP44_4190 [Candidatus Neomarinimicrobiota bacterium]
MNDPRLNFNWCVEQTQIIHCKRSKIWETISLESNLELFHPFCKKNNIITWPGDKSEDILVYLNGRTMTRKFVFWEKNFGYDLFINEIGFESSFVSWRINRLMKIQKLLSQFFHIFIIKGIKNLIGFHLKYLFSQC